MTQSSQRRVGPRHRSEARVFSRHRLGLAAPSASALILRLTQLLLLFALSTVADPEKQSAFVAGFGMIAAFAVMTDAGAVNYILASGRDALARATYLRVLAVQLGFGALGGVLALTYSLAVFEQVRSREVVAILAALSISQVIDSLVRAARTPLLLRSRDSDFATFDLLLAVGKIAPIALALLTREIAWLMLLPVASAAVLVPAMTAGLRDAVDGPAAPRLLLSILPYGANGAASSLYSQVPLIAAGWALPIHLVAVLTVCYRITQPLELLPATISQQVVPRADRTARLARTWMSLVAVGTALAVVVVAAKPAVEHLFSISIDPAWVLLFIALSIPVKFGNYGLTAFMFARGFVRAKLRITVAVGLLTVVLAFSAATWGSVGAIAATTLSAELVLAACLAWSLHASPLRRA